jgi:tetratricopeptide (TPR) repeat protein
MMETLKAVRYLLVLGAICTVSASHAAIQDAAATVSIDQLIDQLGDDEYVQRQQAEAQLLERGVEAFAQLQAAEKHPDLEISTRAKYVLNQISIDWVRPADPPHVRSIMARYGELSNPSRLGKVAQLAKLENQQGYAALCRIARFESSGQVARYAALAVLENGFLPRDKQKVVVEMLRGELGENAEAPQSWIHLYVSQLRSPKQIDPRWLTLLDDEIGLLAAETNETSESLALTLLHMYLGLCDHLSDDAAILSGLQRRIEIGANSDASLSASLIDAINWLVDREHWDALSMLEDRYSGSIFEDPLVMYYLAIAREKQGRQDEAETLAKQALEFQGADFEQRNDVALMIADLGHHDWAEREWQAVIDAAEATDTESLSARESMALYRLNDRLEHEAAANLLAEAIDAIDEDPAIKAAFQSDPPALGHLNRARSNRDFFLASHHESKGNYEQERLHLERAYKLERDNADIVIAMYRSKDAPEVYRKTSRRRLVSAVSRLEKSIKQLAAMSPRTSQVKRVLAGHCNHYAWLVSNTEGDFAKAVERSELSLKLDPDNASYLDTLGRCYYAAGDLQSAIKVQREAIAMHPHLMVMRRQLQMFEDSLQSRSQ